MPARLLHVTGLVQGVFYRAHAQAKAQDLGLKGWVKNNEDGSVEIHAEGHKEILDTFEQWCWEASKDAEVTSVTSTAISEEHPTSFIILR